MTSPDPVMQMLERDERHDHFLAKMRGARVAMLAEAVVQALEAGGHLQQPEHAVGPVCRALADGLYGNTALDIPNLREERARDDNTR